MFGIVGYSGQFTRGGLNDALARNLYRGPDDSGVYEKHERDLGLDFACLDNFDRSSFSHQPKHSEDGAVVPVVNGDLVYARRVAKHIDMLLEEIQ